MILLGNYFYYPQKTHKYSEIKTSIFFSSNFSVLFDTNQSLKLKDAQICETNL